MTDRFSGFDEFIHPQPRISIMSILFSAEWVAFSYLRQELKSSDSAISKQISALENKGYVTTEKVSTFGRPRVNIQMTPEGRSAFQKHANALQSMITMIRDKPTP